MLRRGAFGSEPNFKFSTVRQREARLRQLRRSVGVLKSLANQPLDAIRSFADRIKGLLSASRNFEARTKQLLRASRNFEARMTQSVHASRNFATRTK